MADYVLIPALAFSLLTGAAEPQTAQVNRGSLQKKSTQAPLIKVFALRFVDAAEVVGTLDALLPGKGLRITADVRSNSVLVSGSEEELKIVEALLLRLDDSKTTQAKSNGPVFEVMTVRPANAQSIQEAVRIVGRDVRVAFDPRASRLLVSGDEAGVERLRNLIKVLDVPRPPVAEPVKVRVIWLTTDTSAAEPGPHLAKVIQSLDRVGIKGLRQKTQVMANVTEPGSDFSVRGVVGEETQISVTGERQGDSLEPARLDISIEIDRNDKQPPIDLSATVTLGVGQMVVLGATPTGDGQSVFVVELIPGI